MTLIAFEGILGSGKSRITDMVKHELIKRGKSADSIKFSDRRGSRRDINNLASVASYASRDFLILADVGEYLLEVASMEADIRLLDQYIITPLVYRYGIDGTPANMFQLGYEYICGEVPKYIYLDCTATAAIKRCNMTSDMHEKNKKAEPLFRELLSGQEFVKTVNTTKSIPKAFNEVMGIVEGILDDK